MKCPACGDEKQQRRLGSTDYGSDAAYRCGGCERLYIVAATHLSDVVSRLNEMLAKAEELGREHDKSLVRITQAQAVLEVAREQLESVANRIRLAMAEA